MAAETIHGDVIMTMPTEQVMRAAVEKRDRTFDGVFFYGVRTTGIFCRPSCGARPARVANLRFFEDAESALAGGFRPCKRCRPMDAARDLQELVNLSL